MSCDDKESAVAMHSLRTGHDVKKTAGYLLHTCDKSCIINWTKEAIPLSKDLKTMSICH